MLVFDSSTLILLAKADLIDEFLSDYKRKILIPDQVEKESCTSKKSFDAQLIKKRIEEKRIKVVKITNTRLRTRLMQDFRISSGEAEALVLAIEKNADIVATDDRNAIKACKLLKLKFTSAIAILVYLSENGKIDREKAESSLNALIKYGRYNEDIIRKAKRSLKAEQEN